MEIEFTSAKELYQRLYPALKSKALELKRQGFDYIKEEDIWNYLKETKWINSVNLALNEMVSDILNSDLYLIDEYLKNKIKKEPRRAILDEEVKK